MFSPPYLFRGPRPAIISAPASVGYGESFEVSTAKPDDIGKVSWVALPSVTHSVRRESAHQLSAVPGGSREDLSVTAPDSPNLCPSWTLHAVHSEQGGVPSHCPDGSIQAAVAPAAVAAEPLVDVEVPKPGAYLEVRSAARDAKWPRRPGNGCCRRYHRHLPLWYRRLLGWRLRGAARLARRRPRGALFPDTDDSTAEVFLKDDRLPRMDRWDEQFRRLVNGTYEMRGSRSTLRGVIREPRRETVP